VRATAESDPSGDASSDDNVPWIIVASAGALVAFGLLLLVGARRHRRRA
jgi:hypothetical protein